MFTSSEQSGLASPERKARIAKKKLKNKPQAAQEKYPAELALSAFSMWQAWAIAQAVFELAESLETVGAKDSTLDKIDILRQAISEVYDDLTVCEPSPSQGRGESAADGQSGARPVKRKLSACESEMRDIFQAILEQVVSYCPSSEVKPMPSETAHKLRELSERLRHYAGDFKEHVPPMEKLTDKMRVLADDLNHADSEHPTEWIVEQAENVGLMLGIIYSDVALDTEMCGPDHPRSRRKAILTEEESETKSYITQALIILDHIVLGKTWSETCPGDLRYFADQLYKCPPVMQYRKFWNMLKLTKVDAEIKKQKTKAAGNDGTSNTHSKNFRSVTWYGRTYTFNKNQAIAVKLL